MAQYMKPKERECDCIKQKSAQFMSLPEMSLTISNVIAPITFWSISYLHEYGWSVAAYKKMPQELRKPDVQPWAVRASLHNSFHLINRAQLSIQTHKQKPGNYFTCLLLCLTCLLILLCSLHQFFHSHLSLPKHIPEINTLLHLTKIYSQ